ncbi:hypothetical protein A6A04_01250 [Paramagnetospirillum marisnigri]|uniref:Argininosuccinate lyase n=1 Tax=Paramagnetospirillum marisnigri TaxID=1285242 RepID=A0A178MSH4_9PROT|nr:hypothetical protein [Paramagnetospirillum marisnigri]OAN52348.1 hypothetical protein A6A04_01250 [Paramagnetospirillum marisnigri]
MSRRLILAALALLLALPLAACGRKGSPEVPENAVYPRVYPNIPFPPPGARKAPDSQAPSAEPGPVQ